jgi:hypothetical protein
MMNSIACNRAVMCLLSARRHSRCGPGLVVSQASFPRTIQGILVSINLTASRLHVFQVEGCNRAASHKLLGSDQGSILGRHLKELFDDVDRIQVPVLMKCNVVLSAAALLRPTSEVARNQNGTHA